MWRLDGLSSQAPHAIASGFLSSVRHLVALGGSARAAKGLQEDTTRNFQF
jgi:hypothetical protein